MHSAKPICTTVYTRSLSFPRAVFKLVPGPVCAGYLDHFAIEALFRTQIPGGVCVCFWIGGVPKMGTILIITRHPSEWCWIRVSSSVIYFNVGVFVCICVYVCVCVCVCVSVCVCRERVGSKSQDIHKSVQLLKRNKSCSRFEPVYLCFPAKLITSIPLLSRFKYWFTWWFIVLCVCGQMLKHGRAGVPMEVMGLMLGEFVDDYTVRVIDVFAMPQSGTVCITQLFDMM